MSTVIDSRVQTACPNCQQRLKVRPETVGKRAKCPACQGTFTISAPDSSFDFAVLEQSAPPALSQSAKPPVIQQSAPGTQLSDPFAGFSYADSMSQPAKPSQPTNTGGYFAPERRGINGGMVGGILMMLIAVVWFFGGLAVGYIFFYPPVLFVIGIFAMFKGAVEGSVAGNRHQHRY